MVRFTGKQLDQSDLDVWEQVLHLARTQALGTRCYFTATAFSRPWAGTPARPRMNGWLRLCSAGCVLGRDF